MSPDIVIVRDGDGYRLLHGHLRLASLLNACGEAAVEVKGEGKIKIVRSGSAYLASKNGQRLPLYRH